MFLINNHIWNVYCVRPTSKYLIRDNGTYALGVCDKNTMCIYINSNVSISKYTDILTHEICHAFIMEYGLNLSVEDEEAVCRLFTEYGRQMIYVVDEILRGVA